MESGNHPVFFSFYSSRLGGPWILSMWPVGGVRGKTFVDEV